MSLTRRIALAGALSVAALMTSVGLSGVPASAEMTHGVPRHGSLTDAHGCPAVSWCIWDNTGYLGDGWFFNYNKNPHNTWLYVGKNANDSAYSADNNRLFTTAVSKDQPPKNGQWVCMLSYDSVPDLRNETWPDGTAAADSSPGVRGTGTISGFYMQTTTQSLCPKDW